jgi:predicted DNA-binding transcriptional regulator AlpA
VIDELLNELQLRKLLGGISRPTLYRCIKQGRYPRPIKVAQGRNRWPLSSLQSHIAQKISKIIAQSDQISACMDDPQTSAQTRIRLDEHRGRLLIEMRELQSLRDYFDNCSVQQFPIFVPPASTKPNISRQKDIEREVRWIIARAAKITSRRRLI